MNDDADLRAALANAGLDWIVPRWNVPGHVHALVTTRNAGARPFDAAPRDDDPRRAPAGEHDELLMRFVPALPRWLVQVHGADVAIHEPTDDATRARVADAAITAAARVVCAVRTADCLPVLFADRKGRAVGVAHAGWRGLAGGVLEATVGAFTRRGVEPRALVAWLGPAIGPTAFEVGADVRDAFVRADAHAVHAFVSGAPGKWLCDLEALARLRLARCGVEHVAGGGVCTVRDHARFHSWRRDRTAARMAALIWMA